MVTKSRLLRQAKLLKLAKATADPELAASLTARAADLQAEAELLTDEPDQPEKDARCGNPILIARSAALVITASS